MSTKEQRQLVIEYWFRILIGECITIDDISNIINDFGNVYDKFDPDSSSNSVTFENNDSMITFHQTTNSDTCNVFGTEVAKPGKMYHWKLKLGELGEKYLNVGIIEADKCEVEQDSADWWNNAYGFAYYLVDGDIWNNGEFINYGEQCEMGDIIVIYLDLRDNKYELSFARNDKKFGKAANMRHATEYKLVTGGSFTSTKKVEILMFEIM